VSGHQSIAETLRSVTRSRRNHSAIVGDGRSLTYGELAARSDAVAQGFVAAGMSPGDRVAFLDRNATEYWETFLGALKAGVVIVPLNFRLAGPELAWILDDADVSMTIAGAAFAAELPDDGRPVVVTGAREQDDGSPSSAIEFEDWIAGQRGGDPSRDVSGSGLVQLIYSSGTTGHPKGVQISDDQLAWSVNAFGSCFDVNAESRSLVPVPYYHVAGGGWSLITLSVGGQIVQSREPTAESMLAQLLEFRATHTAMVPAVMQVLTTGPQASGADFSALRQVVYGGSPISQPLMLAATSVLGVELFQSYGLTETCGTTTLLAAADHRPDSDMTRLRSAGRAVPGVELDIIDPDTGRSLPPGEVGEVVTRAPSVTPGYWRRPEETAHAFLPGGWFRTGDAGSLDEGGYLFIRDRIKDMIVTGGENVYPAEIESVLAGHPAVADVAVIGVPSDKWGETPLAVVVAKSGSTPDTADIVAYSRARLAHFKCPTDVVLIEELPRNPSGKVLKRELRAPYWAGHERAIG
jgi:acyl-CoA synthetase (AMP-forming)/AMP-acid ligase II